MKSPTIVYKYIKGHLKFQFFTTWQDDDAESDEDWKRDKDSDSDTEEEVEFEEESTKNILAKPSRAHELAAVWALLCFFVYLSQACDYSLFSARN